MEVLEHTVTEAYNLFSKKDYTSALSVLDTSDSEIQKELTDKTQGQREVYLASVQNLRGFICLGMNHNPEAQNCFETALQYNPNSSQACAGLGEVFYLESKDEEAKIMFEWALDLNSGNKFAASGLTKVNQSLGLPASHNSLEADSMTPEELAIFNTCIIDAYKLFKEKKFADSLEKVKKAQELVTTGIMSNSALQKISSLENFKGFNYLALNDNESALKCFEKALNLDPFSSQACAGLGELYYLYNLDSEAKTMYEYAVIHDSENEFAVSGLTKVNKALDLEETDNSLLKKKAG
jgi:tetratricopeptide (TPR) repeat protein